ncbi:hypothetical protein KY334_06490 [Candidatus Woesearchaeota archaeon]|nr:hypothetical protein [Candidatus Woesearchaeota archaeon]
MKLNKNKGFVKMLFGILLLVMLSSLVIAAPSNAFTFDSEYDYVESKGDFSAERFELTSTTEGLTTIFEGEQPIIRVGNELSNLEIEASEFEIRFRPENGILKIGDKRSPKLSFEIRDFLSIMEIGNPNLLSNMVVYDTLVLSTTTGNIVYDSLFGNLVLESKNANSGFIINTNMGTGFITYEPKYDEFGGAIIFEQNASFETLDFTADDFYNLIEALKKGSPLHGRKHTVGECEKVGGTAVNPIYFKEGLNDTEIKALPALYDGTDVCWINGGSVSGWTMLEKWTLTRENYCYGGNPECRIDCGAGTDRPMGEHPFNLKNTIEHCYWYYGHTNSDWDDDDNCDRSHARNCYAIVLSGAFY